MQNELTALRPQLLETSDETERLMIKIEQDTIQVEAKKEIVALEAKCLAKVPSDQIPRRRNKRKSETTGELQSKSATIKLPPQKKSKETAQKQTTAESDPKITYA